MSDFKLPADMVDEKEEVKASESATGYPKVVIEEVFKLGKNLATMKDVVNMR